MVSDITLIALFMSSKEIYTTYRPYVRLGALSKEAKLILSDLGLYYEEFPDEKFAQIDKFTTWFHQIRNPDFTETKLALYNQLWTQVSTQNLEDSEEFVKGIIRHFKKADFKERILTHLEESHNFSVETLTDILEQYQHETRKTEQVFAPFDPAIFLKAIDKKGGLKWRLNCLQKALGGFIKGEFGVIAAPVNAGKSSLMISEAVHFAAQLETGCVLFFTTEQTAEQVQARLMSSALGLSGIYLDPYNAEQLSAYKEMMHGDAERIKVCDAKGFGVHDIRRQIKQYKPSLVIVDMLDDIYLKGAASQDGWADLKRLYQAFRHLAVECPILGSSQCSADTEFTIDGERIYQHFIRDTQMEGSKRGKQGKADFLIMMGFDPKWPSTRFINVAKQKTNHPIQSEVSFDIGTSTFTDHKFE